jgi:hypothetical protein
MENLNAIIQVIVYSLMFGTVIICGAMLIAEANRLERIREIERQTWRQKYNRD